MSARQCSVVALPRRRRPGATSRSSGACVVLPYPVATARGAAQPAEVAWLLEDIAYDAAELQAMEAKAVKLRQSLALARQRLAALVRCEGGASCA